VENGDYSLSVLVILMKEYGKKSGMRLAFCAFFLYNDAIKQKGGSVWAN